MFVRIRILLCLLIVTAEGWRPYEITVHNLTYVVEKTNFGDLKITNFTKNKIQYFSGVGSIFKDVYHPFLHFEIIVDTGSGHYNYVYANRTVNVCTFLDNQFDNLPLRLSYKKMSEYVDLPKKCPLFKKVYKVQNFSFTGDNLPPYLPDGEALFYGSVWLMENGKKIMLGNGNAAAGVKRKFKKN